MHFLHINWGESGNIFNRIVSLLNGDSEGTVGERKENASPATPLNWFCKRWEISVDTCRRTCLKTKLQRKHRVNTLQSYQCAIGVSDERKTSSPFQIWNSSPGRNIRNGTLLKCEAKQRATRRQMIGCQDLSKTHWSSHKARRLSQFPGGLERARSAKQEEERVTMRRS